MMTRLLILIAGICFQFSFSANAQKLISVSDFGAFPMIPSMTELLFSRH